MLRIANGKPSTVITPSANSASVAGCFEPFPENHPATHQRPQQPRPREPEQHQHGEIRAKPASPREYRREHRHNDGADDSQQAPDGRLVSQVVAFAATALPEREAHAHLLAAEERVYGDGDEVVGDGRDYQ